MNPTDYDACIAFFVKRGFKRASAESTAYVILAQAKIDSISPQEILDKLNKCIRSTTIRTNNTNIKC